MKNTREGDGILTGGKQNKKKKGGK